MNDDTNLGWTEDNCKARKVVAAMFGRDESKIDEQHERLQALKAKVALRKLDRPSTP